MLFYGSNGINATQKTSTNLLQYVDNNYIKPPILQVENKSSNKQGIAEPERFNFFYYIGYIINANVQNIFILTSKQILSIILKMLFLSLLIFLISFSALIFTAFYLIGNLTFAGVVTGIIALGLLYGLIKTMSLTNPAPQQEKISEISKNASESYMNIMLDAIDIRYQSVFEDDNKLQIINAFIKMRENTEQLFINIITNIIPRFASIFILYFMAINENIGNTINYLYNLMDKYIGESYKSLNDYTEQYSILPLLPSHLFVFLVNKFVFVMLTIEIFSFIKGMVPIFIYSIMVGYFHMKKYTNSLVTETDQQFSITLSEIGTLKDCNIVTPIIQSLQSAASINEEKKNGVEYIIVLLTFVIIAISIILIFALSFFTKNTATSNSLFSLYKMKLLNNPLVLAMSVLPDEAIKSINMPIKMKEYFDYVKLLYELCTYVNMIVEYSYTLGMLFVLGLIINQINEIQNLKSIIYYINDLRKIPLSFHRRLTVENIVEIQTNKTSIYHDMALGPILTNVSLNIKQGHVYIILGPSGSGKTTFKDALLGKKFIQPYGSMSCFDGSRYVPYEVIDANGLMVLSGQVRQTVALPGNQTVFQLLNSGGNAVNEEKIMNILDLVLLTSWARDNNIYTTPLGEGGSNLSGGQRRRVALAMLIALDKKINIIDEALDSLDGEVAKHIVWNVLCKMIVPTDIYNTAVLPETSISKSGKATKLSMFLEENASQKKIFFIITHRPDEILDAIRQYFINNNIDIKYLDDLYSILMFGDSTIREIKISDYEKGVI